MTNIKKKNFLIFTSIFFLLFFNNIVQANNVKNSAVVFMYHKFGNSKYPSTNITLEQFEQHLKEFSKEKYNVLPLEYIVDTIINDGILPENTIGITVDDADRTFFDVAWPKFKEFNFPVTLFISTSYIHAENKKYLNWDEIRMLKKEGLYIGAHSHKHDHLADYNKEQLKEEISKSNKIFLKEIGQIPNLFAYPYGETNDLLINLLKEYNYKAAFGQHSGVINETSNFSYLPRFSLNEKYGNIDRVIFTANSKGLGIYDFIPENPSIKDNPPYIGFSLLNQFLSKTINCFIFDSKGKVESEVFKFNERIEIRLKRKLEKGRSRLNCTAKDSENNWRWFGHQFYL